MDATIQKNIDSGSVVLAEAGIIFPKDSIIAKTVLERFFKS
jgi:hypothetical protein